MEANLFGAWRTTQALLPLLRRSRRGRMVNVSSGAGSHGDPRLGRGDAAEQRADGGFFRDGRALGW